MVSSRGKSNVGSLGFNVEIVISPRPRGFPFLFGFYSHFNRVDLVGMVFHAHKLCFQLLNMSIHLTQLFYLIANA